MWQQFSLDSIAPAPWKNGGGQTLPLACWPPGAGLEDFGWRVSIATIAASGPFSVFGGVDRVIMLLDGAGMALRADDGSLNERIDQPLHPFAFTGDTALHCDLLGGPTQDFNLMLRRQRMSGRVLVHRAQPSMTHDLPPSPHGLLLAWRGHWQLQADQSPAPHLQPGQGLWWADADTSPALRAYASHDSGDSHACLIQVCIDAA